MIFLIKIRIFWRRFISRAMAGEEYLGGHVVLGFPTLTSITMQEFNAYDDEI